MSEYARDLMMPIRELVEEFVAEISELRDSRNSLEEALARFREDAARREREHVDRIAELKSRVARLERARAWDISEIDVHLASIAELEHVATHARETIAMQLERIAELEAALATAKQPEEPEPPFRVGENVVWRDRAYVVEACDGDTVDLVRRATGVHIDSVEKV